jgi:hypothetical protein
MPIVWLAVSIVSRDRTDDRLIVDLVPGAGSNHRHCDFQSFDKSCGRPLAIDGDKHLRQLKPTLLSVVAYGRSRNGINRVSYCPQRAPEMRPRG